MGKYFHKASSRQQGGHRPGTVANRHRALKMYVSFTHQAWYEYDSPTTPLVCAFIEYVAEIYKSPKSVRNVLGSLCTYFKLAEIPHLCMDTIQVSNALRSLDLQTRHVPNQKLPVLPKQLGRIVMTLQQGENSEMIALGVILMFAAMLRQSNLFPASTKRFDPTRHFCVKDITVTHDSAILRVKWSKTLQVASDARTITLRRISGSALCPIRALRRAEAVRRDAAPAAPLLQYTDGQPITIGYVRRRWDLALRALALPSSEYSLHSLRRGSASFVYYDAGAKLNDIKRRGT